MAVSINMPSRMWNNMVSALQTFFSNPVIGIVVTILLLVGGWKMTAYGANWLLCVAWAVGSAYFFFAAPIPKPLFPAFLWTALFASAFAIFIYYCLWSWPENLLTPASDARPQLNLPPNKPANIPDEAVTVAKQEIVIFLGKFACSTSEPSFTVLRAYGKDLLTIKRLKWSSKISVSVDVWTQDGKIAATIEDNQFRVNPNNTLPVKRPDYHTLIVEDERKHQVLYIRFINPSTVRISGTFWAGGKYPVIVDDESISFGPLLILGGIALHVQGRSIFDWPGELPNQKSSADTKPPSDKATLRPVSKDNVMNVILTDTNGDEYSLFQIGGPDVRPGVKLWPAFEFKLQSVSPPTTQSSSTQLGDVLKNQSQADKKLDEITRLVKDAGENFSPQKLLDRYPLGYVIFDIDYKNSVSTYDSHLVMDNYDLDWSGVGFTKLTADEYELKLPDIRKKGGGGGVSNVLIGGKKQIGAASGAFVDDLSEWGEILAIREKGIVFVVGFSQGPNFKGAP